MENDVHFSIVTVVRDDLEGLKISRESLVSQKYSEWTHIIIDGSTGGEILEYLRTLPKQNTIYLSELDSGIYSAMNKGWRLARSDSFVFFLNARDRFAGIDALVNANRALKMHASPLWGCTTHEEINRDGSGWVCKLVSEPDIRNQLYAFGYRSHQAVVMRSSLIKELGGFNETFRIAADWDLIVRALLRVKPVEWQKPIAIFELGGESSVKLFEAHQELMALRKIYLPRTIRNSFYELVWRAIYLRPLGYVNIFTPLIKFAFTIDLSKRSQLAARKILQTIKRSNSKKNKSLRKFPMMLLRQMEYLSAQKLIKLLHGKLSLKPLK